MFLLGIIAQLVESFLSGCEQREGGSSAGQGAAFWGRGSQLVIVQIQGLPLCASFSPLCLLVGDGFRLGSTFSRLIVIIQETQGCCLSRENL